MYLSPIPTREKQELSNTPASLTTVRIMVNHLEFNTGNFISLHVNQMMGPFSRIFKDLYQEAETLERYKWTGSEKTRGL